MSPKVSIIVPVYNVQEYISKTIDSLVMQNYNNIEILLIDDGSSDSSGAICDEYANRYNNIRVFHKINGGVTSARKLGLEMSTGNWIVFVDGDDQLTIDAVKYLIENALTYRACVVNTPFIYKKNQKCYLQQMKSKGIHNSMEYMTLLLKGDINWGIGGKIYAKYLFQPEVMNISPLIKNNEDLIMNLRMAKYINSSLSLPEKGVYFYEYRAESASHSSVSYENRLEVYKEIKNTVSEELANNFIIDSLWNAYLHGESIDKFLSYLLEELDVNLNLCDIRRKLQVRHILSNSKIYYYIIRTLLLFNKLKVSVLWK